MDYQALVKRLRANLDKYPGFVNLNADAATAIETLLARQKVLVKEVRELRDLINGQGGYEEHCGHITPEGKATCRLIGCRVSAARDATDAAFPEGLPR